MDETESGKIEVINTSSIAKPGRIILTEVINMVLVAKLR